MTTNQTSKPIKSKHLIYECLIVFFCSFHYSNPLSFLFSGEAEEFKALEEVSRKETKAERYFNRFKEILKKEPDQVILDIGYAHTIVYLQYNLMSQLTSCLLTVEAGLL